MKTKISNATQLRHRFIFISINVAKVALAVFIFLSVVIVATLGLFYHTAIYEFKRAAHLNNTQILDLIRTSLHTPIQQTNHRKNILLLGTDKIANRVGDPVLTDTIMIISINTQTGSLHVLSLPRDLWSDEYKTKINALYEYGQQKNSTRPEQFPTQVIAELMGIDIHHTVVLSLDQLKELIDLLGGIEVHVPESFVDDQFPRSDVDIRTESDPQKLYERVVFVKGQEIMSGERALQYVRSRHSASTQGTDDARTIRQQLVISALLKKIKDKEVVLQPELLGNLYRWYYSNFHATISVEEIMSLSKNLGTTIFQTSLIPQTLSIQTPESEGVLFHPPISTHNQWVYQVKEIEQFRKEVRQKLDLD